MGNTGVVVREASTVTFTSDGYTINWTTAAGGAPDYIVLALGGDAISAAYAGIILQATTISTQFNSLPIFDPSVLLFSNIGSIPSAVSLGDFNYGFGTATPDDEGSMWVGTINHKNPQDAAKAADTFDSIICATCAADAASSTIDGLAGATGFFHTGFSLDWSITDGIAREVMFLAIGAAPIVPTIDHSGMYKIEKDKRNDTIYSSVTEATTEDVKIPDPSITTAFMSS